MFGDFLKQKTTPDIFFFFLTERQAKKAKEEVTSSQSFGQLTIVLSQDKKTWEFFSRIAQFFNLQIGFTWKFHLSRHSRFRRPSLFPHSLPADFSPSLTNLVNTIYKGKTDQNFIL